MSKKSKILKVLGCMFFCSMLGGSVSLAMDTPPNNSDHLIELSEMISSGSNNNANNNSSNINNTNKETQPKGSDRLIELSEILSSNTNTNNNTITNTKAQPKGSNRLIELSEILSNDTDTNNNTNTEINTNQSSQNSVKALEPWEAFGISQNEYKEKIKSLVEQKSKKLSNKSDDDMYRFMANVGKDMLIVYSEGMAFPVEKEDAIENIKRFIQGMVIVDLKNKTKIPNTIICKYDDEFGLEFHYNSEGVRVQAGHQSNEQFLEEEMVRIENELKNPKHSKEYLIKTYNNSKLSLKISKDVKELIDRNLSKDFLENIYNRMKEQRAKVNELLEKIQDDSYYLTQSQVKAKLAEGRKLGRRPKKNK